MVLTIDYLTEQSGRKDRRKDNCVEPKANTCYTRVPCKLQ